MAATNRSSTLFTNYETNKYIPTPADRGGSLYPIFFSATIVSASNIGDTYDLFTVPAGWTVFSIYATSNGLSATTTAGCTVQIGDSTDDDRLMAATDMDAVNQIGFTAYAGVAYTPTVDTIYELKIGTAAAVVGKIIKGGVLLVQH